MNGIFRSRRTLSLLMLLFVAAPATRAAQPLTLDMLPKVALTRPASVQAGSSFVLRGNAQASAGLVSAEAYIDNRPLFSRPVSGTSLDIGTLGINVPVTGSHTVRFVVRDKSNKIMQDAFQISAQQSPLKPVVAAGDAAITFNPPNARAGALVLISGMVSSTRGLQQVDLTLLFKGAIVGSERRVISGAMVQLDSLGWRPNLPGAGVYTLTIVVTDRNLAKTSKTFTFGVNG